MGLVETYVTRDSRFNFSQFQKFNTARRAPRSGGASLLVRKDIPPKQAEIPQGCLPEGNDAVMARVHFNRKRILV
jgi:hypothetical protein